MIWFLIEEGIELSYGCKFSRRGNVGAKLKGSSGVGREGGSTKNMKTMLVGNKYPRVVYGGN